MPRGIAGIAIPGAILIPQPASVILAWATLTLALQWLPTAAVLCLAAAIFPAALWFSGKRFGKLLRRARWLLLSLGLLFAFATPGEALLFGAVTREGLSLAANHLLRLGLLLALVALLLERFAIPQLIAGLYQLLTPLGAGRDRLALRLLLVLDYVEQGVGRWQDGFAETGIQADHPPLRLQVSPFSGIDYVVMALCITSLSVLALW